MVKPGRVKQPFQQTPADLEQPGRLGERAVMLPQMVSHPPVDKGLRHKHQQTQCTNRNGGASKQEHADAYTERIVTRSQAWCVGSFSKGKSMSAAAIKAFLLYLIYRLITHVLHFISIGYATPATTIACPVLSS